ncbi:CPBP family intramembrane metalloprotease [Leptobacterium flavescens]|uniref:CPBP family intramembrane metalloprotease n=1 Tax=Leptobacterium flavescens TaxID=472055 RepID=A0A6P0UQL6_9FLAO|nr:CPBP family intramembrane glutamic endopeptidase [Leptobacterium flavescens]NER15405.1 CPBP family intramembrane metalloprotease [Leptobacterium flavescens]
MIQRIPSFALAIIITLAIAIIIKTPFDMIFQESYFSTFQIEYLTLALRMSLIFLMGLILTYKLTEKALSGLSSKYKWSFKYINLIPFYLIALGISTFIGKDLSSINIYNVLLLFFACSLVSFAEEFVFRGFLQPLFITKYNSNKNGIFLGVLLPAILFGSVHLLNLTINDNIPQVIAQSIYAIFIGFFFGVALLKTNKLIPLAITHGLINFFFLFGSLPGFGDATSSGTESVGDPTLSEQISSSLSTVLIFLPLFIIGLIILRKMDKKEIQKKINFNNDQLPISNEQ